jgi:hypothetical protein
MYVGLQSRLLRTSQKTEFSFQNDCGSLTEKTPELKSQTEAKSQQIRLSSPLGRRTEVVIRDVRPVHGTVRDLQILTPELTTTIAANLIPDSTEDVFSF